MALFLELVKYSFRIGVVVKVQQEQLSRENGFADLHMDLITLLLLAQWVREAIRERLPQINFQSLPGTGPCTT